MSTHDKQGRPWAKLSEIKFGDKIQVDGDFPCIFASEVKEVKTDGEKLYVECTEGKHFLAGQLSDDKNTLIGIYKVEA